MKLHPCLLLACSLCLTPALLWGADPPDKGKDLSADAELLAAAAPPAIALPRATRKDDPASKSKVPVSAVSGQRAEAKIAIGKQTHSLRPNQVGSFGRILIGPKAKADIQVAYAKGQAGEVVLVQPMDGGRVGDKLGGLKLELDKQGMLRFQFEANEERGIYRVLLRKQTDLKLVEFWVGDPLPVSERRKPEAKETK